MYRCEYQDDIERSRKNKRLSNGLKKKERDNVFKMNIETILVTPAPKLRGIKTKERNKSGSRLQNGPRKLKWEPLLQLACLTLNSIAPGIGNGNEGIAINFKPRGWVSNFPNFR